MTRARTYLATRGRLTGFWREENGTTLVEFALVLSLFLLLIFGLIDFGRLAYHYVTVEKAINLAARIAVVRPPACATPADFWIYEVDPNNADVPPPEFGAHCQTNVCKAKPTLSCTGDAAAAPGDAKDTVDEIWTVMDGLLPSGSGRENLMFSYTFDDNLGFLGGPYVPIVTVELRDVQFEFVSPLGALAGMAMGTGPTDLGGQTNSNMINFPALSVSLPAEDLAHGMPE